MLRPRLIPPDDVFPPSPWAIEAVRFDGRLGRDLTGQTETMFALSNGHLGLRGIADEGRPVTEAGTDLNGFYEHRPISYGERAYGFPSRGQSILICPDGIAMALCATCPAASPRPGPVPAGGRGRPRVADAVRHRRGRTGGHRGGAGRRCLARVRPRGGDDA